LPLSETSARVFDALVEPVVVVAADGSIAYINRQVTALFGYAAPDILGQPIERLLPADRRSVHVAQREAFFRHAGTRPMAPGRELNALRRDGTEFPVAVSLVHITRDAECFVVAVVRDLSEQKRTERTLRASEQQLRLVLGSANIGIWDWDVASGELTVDEGWLKIMGWDAADPPLTIDEWRATLHPEDVSRLKPLVSDVIHNPAGRHFEAELRAQRPDGTTRWVLSKGAVVERGVEGDPLRVVGTLMDISQRKTAEADLRSSERKLRGLYAVPHVGIALTDGMGRLLEFNEAYRNICGYSTEELQSLDYRDLTPDTYRQNDADNQRTLQRDGYYGPYEKAYIRKDGSLIPLQFNGVLLQDADGGQRIWSIVEDITERKNLEHRLMRESTRNQLFLHTASDGVHILNAAGCIVEASDSFCSMLGCERDAVIGMHPSRWDASLQSEELAATLRALFDGSLKRFQTRHRRKDGTVFPVEVHAEAFELDGEPHVFCSARDISEQRRLEQAVLQATGREQQSLGRDLHDGLGQELTGISLLADAIAHTERRAGRPAADELENLAALARRAIGNCRAISHGLSPLSYAAGGLIAALREMVNLQHDIFRTTARFQTTAGAPLNLWPEASDHLYRIAQEALANARRHAEANLIEVILDVRPASVRLEIRDDGIGLKPQSNPAGGMGLKIMQFRAAIIGARLTVDSLLEGGARVLCECPHLAFKPF
jgi:PAS domain S-box-containing protein